MNFIYYEYIHFTAPFKKTQVFRSWHKKRMTFLKSSSKFMIGKVKMKMISWALFELFTFKDFVLSAQITHFMKLINNNRKSAKMILIFWCHWNQLAKMYLNLKGRLNRTNGLVFMAQIPSVSFYQEQRRFWKFWRI